MEDSQEVASTATPIHRLPNVVLRRIFDYFTREHYKQIYKCNGVTVYASGVPCYVYQVCLRWKQAMHEHPTFWYCLQIELDSPNVTGEDVTAISSLTGRPHYRIIGKTIRILFLTDMLPSQLAVLEEGAFPALERLDVTFRPFEQEDDLEDGQVIPAFKSAPLTNVCLPGSWVHLSLEGKMPLPWNRIQHIEEKYPSSRQNDQRPSAFLSPLLAQCTSLKTLKIRARCAESQKISTIPAGWETVTLPRLETITVSICSSISSRTESLIFPDLSFWDAFEFPSLEMMNIECAGGVSLPFPAGPLPRSITENLRRFTFQSIGRQLSSCQIEAARTVLGQLSKVDSLFIYPEAWRKRRLPKKDYLKGHLVRFLRNDLDPESVVLPELQFLSVGVGSSEHESKAAILRDLASGLLELLEYTSSQKGKGHRMGLTQVTLGMLPIDTSLEEEVCALRSVEDACSKHGVELVIALLLGSFSTDLRYFIELSDVSVLPLSSFICTLVTTNCGVGSQVRGRVRSCFALSPSVYSTMMYPLTPLSELLSSLMVRFYPTDLVNLTRLAPLCIPLGRARQVIPPAVCGNDSAPEKSKRDTTSCLFSSSLSSRSKYISRIALPSLSTLLSLSLSSLFAYIHSRSSYLLNVPQMNMYWSLCVRWTWENLKQPAPNRATGYYPSSTPSFTSILIHYYIYSIHHLPCVSVRLVLTRSCEGIRFDSQNLLKTREPGSPTYELQGVALSCSLAYFHLPTSTLFILETNPKSISRSQAPTPSAFPEPLSRSAHSASRTASENRTATLASTFTSRLFPFLIPLPLLFTFPPKLLCLKNKRYCRGGSGMQGSSYGSTGDRSAGPVGVDRPKRPQEKDVDSGSAWTPPHHVYPCIR
ncbi:hypothetical protein NMY22_g16877 [Coprinellus aureogranulatus]|nr:hypothetical protein NMY22_g16877 [Coprinellus aureogranulatus]